MTIISRRFMMRIAERIANENKIDALITGESLGQVANMHQSVEELSSGSSDYAASTWIAWFLSTKGNEYFCEIDEDYILDRFNLTGLNTEVQHYTYALDLITDALGTWHAQMLRLIV